MHVLQANTSPKADQQGARSVRVENSQKELPRRRMIALRVRLVHSHLPPTISAFHALQTLHLSMRATTWRIARATLVILALTGVRAQRASRGHTRMLQGMQSVHHVPHIRAPCLEVAL